MAKFPDEDAFGAALPSTLERQEAPYNEVNQARGGMDDTAPAAGDEPSRDQLERATADIDYIVKMGQIRGALSNETDADGLSEKYEPQIWQIHSESAAQISDPKQRELWLSERMPDAEGHVGAVADYARDLVREREIGRADTRLQEALQAGALANDPAMRDHAIRSANDLINGLQVAGHISETQARERQRAWAENFALAAFSKLPATDQVKWLESNPRDGDAGQGELIDFVPEAKRERLLQTAQLDLRNEERATQSAAALARYRTESLVRDDLASILKSGKGADDVTPDEVQAALGPDIAARWRQAREDYRLIHNHSHDLYALTESEIEARLRALKPEHEGAESRKTAVFRAVQERADDLRHTRLTDPARSVADDPLIRAAAERAQSDDPQAVRELHTARLAAQERAGIDPSAQSPITKDEALSLIAPLRDAKMGEERDALRRLGESFRTQFGADAERTFAFALRALASDTQEAVAVKQMLNSVELREDAAARDPQPSDAPIATDGPVAEGAAAASDPQSGLPEYTSSTVASGASTEDSQAPAPFADDRLFGWDAIGSQARERDGLEVTLTGLMAASGRGRGKNPVKAILDFFRGAPVAPPPPERDKETKEPPPDITPLLPSERPRRLEAPLSIGDETLSQPAVSSLEADDLRRRVAAKASLEEIAALPVIRNTIAAMKTIPETATEAEVKDPVFTTTREFEFKGERFVGYDAAASRLTKLAREYSTEGAVRNQGVATIVTGPPAAGKSTFSERIARKRFAAIVDIDDAKPMMREYKGGIGGQAVHRESTELASRALIDLTANRSNLVIPKIGSNAAQIEDLIHDLRALGYRVDMVHVDVPPDEAFRRNALRYLEKGRLVPPKLYENVSSNTRNTYYTLKEKGILYDWAEIDNSGSTGAARLTDGHGELARVLRQQKN